MAQSVRSSKVPSGAVLKGCLLFGARSIFVGEPLAMRNNLSFGPNIPSCFLYSTSLPYRWLHNMAQCCWSEWPCDYFGPHFPQKNKRKEEITVILYWVVRISLKTSGTWNHPILACGRKLELNTNRKIGVGYDPKFPCCRKRNKENWDVSWGRNNNRVTTTERSCDVILSAVNITDVNSSQLSSLPVCELLVPITAVV